MKSLLFRTALTTVAGIAIFGMCLDSASAENFHGRVTNRSTGMGLRGAAVHAISTDEKHDYKTKTDADGYYTIFFVATGTYRISAGGNGRYEQRYYNDRPNWRSADFVTARSARTLGDIDFQLEVGKKNEEGNAWKTGSAWKTGGAWKTENEWKTI